MFVEKKYYIYIVASLSGTLYIGVTSSLIRRIAEHKEGKIEGFSKKYSCHKLVYYEIFGDVNAAIGREKEIKRWRREKKEELIKNMNPHWNDLYNEIV
jgi:putative endonuclease